MPVVRQDSRHVLEEDGIGADLVNDASDVGPEVAAIVLSFAPPGVGEGLAREPGRDDIHLATPRLAVEGGEVIPERRWGQGAVFHVRCQRCGCIGFPLHVTDALVTVSEFQLDSEFKPSAPCTEGDPFDGIGTYSQVMPPP
tara:strand:- start:1638 stop:2060 length:423 start_codon:yes stop_codon:yes gene_type:complete